MVMTMKNKSRKNERNPLKEKREYSYVIDSFGGLDLLSPDGKSADSRFPYLVNMYRDRRKGSGIETFPGYRALPKQLGDGAERVYGLYAHTFEGKDYLLSLAKHNLDKAMYASLEHSLEYVRARGNTVDADSLEAIEYFRNCLNL